MKPGVYSRHELTNEQYHADREYVSSSGLKMVTENPEKFYAAYRSPVIAKQEKKCFSFGSAVHAVVLEPDTLERDFFVMPELNLRTNAGKAEKAEIEKENKDKTIITAEEFEVMDVIRARVNADPFVSKVLQNSENEKSFFVDRDIKEKIRIDALKNGLIFDVKTFSPDKIGGFERDIANFKYHLSAAMYSDVYEYQSGEAPGGFFFIVIELKPPYAVYVRQLDDESFMAGVSRYQKARDEYKRMSESGKWYDIKKIRLPEWELRNSNKEF